MNRKKLLARALAGSILRFEEFILLIEAFGFHLSRVKGSHHVYVHSTIQELINVQRVGKEAKPYQIRQFFRLVERYNMKMIGDSE